MKRIIPKKFMAIPSILFVCLTACSLSAISQITQTKEQWQSDIEFLQQTVHDHYSTLFRKITAQQFDREVGNLISRLPVLDHHQIVVGISKLVSLFGYGHTNLWLMGWDADNIYGFHQMPYNLYYFSDGVFVQGVHEQYANTLGARVLEVEGVPVLDALELMRPVVPVENEQFFKAYAVGYLGTPEVLHAQGIKAMNDHQVTLTLSKDGQTFKQAFDPLEIDEYPLKYGLITQHGPWLDARDQSHTPYWLKHLDRIYYYEYIAGHKTLYVRHSQIQDDSIAIPEFYQEVFDFIEKNDVQKLVLDVRLNGGGNNYKNKPIITSIILSPRINSPGKLFVIVGRRTFSACQNLVNEIDNYTNATFVGEPSGENINFLGDNSEITLPHSKISVRLSFAWWQDKPQWENRPWLAPDLAVDMSFSDYRDNRDPVLETILDYSGDQGTLDPMEYLTQLYMSGKQDQIFPEAQRLVNDSRYRYYPFQESFNQLGYQLLNTRQFESAVMVMQMNTALFPESANVWDSLAEAYWRNGDITKAKELYQKAVSMDPDGRVGDNSRKMLERISQQEQ